MDSFKWGVNEFPRMIRPWVSKIRQIERDRTSSWPPPFKAQHSVDAGNAWGQIILWTEIKCYGFNWAQSTIEWLRAFAPEGPLPSPSEFKVRLQPVVDSFKDESLSSKMTGTERQIIGHLRIIISSDILYTIQTLYEEQPLLTSEPRLTTNEDRLVEQECGADFDRMIAADSAGLH